MAIGEEQNRLAEYFEGLSIEEEQRAIGGQNRGVEVRQLQDLVVHATDCRASVCYYPNCPKAKGLFHHHISCRTRAAGGCDLCKKMWFLLQLHARVCQESDCRVPRCRDLKEYLQQQPQQPGPRRGAAGSS